MSSRCARRARKRRIRCTFRARTPGHAPAWAPRSYSSPLRGMLDQGVLLSLAAHVAAATGRRITRRLKRTT